MFCIESIFPRPDMKPTDVISTELGAEDVIGRRHPYFDLVRTDNGANRK